MKYKRRRGKTNKRRGRRLKKTHCNCGLWKLVPSLTVFQSRSFSSVFVTFSMGFLGGWILVHGFFFVSLLAPIRSSLSLEIWSPLPNPSLLAPRRLVRFGFAKRENIRSGEERGEIDYEQSLFFLSPSSETQKWTSTWRMVQNERGTPITHN